jgi:ABC-type Na+ efflux pump permease subunit
MVMQLRQEQDSTSSEARYYPETVKKAVALAQRLEHERRETLSLEQVTQLANELNIDPQLLRQALAQVSAEETRPTMAQVQTPVARQQSRNRTAQILLVIALLLAIPLLLMLGYVSTSVAPPQVATPAEVVTPAATPALQATPSQPPTTPPSGK